MNTKLKATIVFILFASLATTTFAVYDYVSQEHTFQIYPNYTLTFDINVDGATQGQEIIFSGTLSGPTPLYDKTIIIEYKNDLTDWTTATTTITSGAGDYAVTWAATPSPGIYTFRARFST